MCQLIETEHVEYFGLKVVLKSGSFAEYLQKDHDKLLLFII